MRKSLILLAVVSLIFSYNNVFAQLSSEQEERLRGLEAGEKAFQEWEKNRPQMEQKIPDKLSGGISVSPQQPGISDPNSNRLNNGIGRYQAIRLDSNAIFIIDTKEGHMWVWVIQKDNQGQPSELLFYQGQVSPGSDMGDLIDRTYKKSRN
jgi:hypothetical protein